VKRTSGVYFDGCHHNNELTGIVCAQKIKKTSLCRVCPFVKTYIFATFPCFLTDATSKDYNKDPSTSFNLKKSLL
jgi:hypothetical protein